MITIENEEDSFVLKKNRTFLQATIHPIPLDQFDELLSNECLIAPDQIHRDEPDLTFRPLRRPSNEVDPFKTRIGKLARD